MFTSMSLIYERSKASDQVTSSIKPSCVHVCDQATSSCTLPNACDQTTKSSPCSASEQEAARMLTSPIAYDQASRCTASLSIGDPATSCSSTQCGIKDQATRSTASCLSVSDLATSSSIPPNVNNDDTAYSRITDHSGNDEQGYNRLHNISYTQVSFQPINYHPLVDDDNAYQEIADDESSNPQTVRRNNSELNRRVQATSTSETSFNATVAEPQQVAEYILPFNEDTGLSRINWKCIAITILVLFTVEVLGVTVTFGLFYSNIWYKSYNSAPEVTKVNYISRPTLIDAFGVKRKPFSPPVKYQEVLRFSDMIRNVSSSNFNAMSSIFNVPASHLSHTLYWMHVGIEESLHTSVHFIVGNTPLYLMKHFVTNTPVILSKSHVVQLKPNSSLSITSKVNGNVSVTTAYWSGFQLNMLMHPLVTFSAEACGESARNGKTKPKRNATQQLIKVFCDTVLINEGKAWDTGDSSFTARHSGIYVFSVIVFIHLKLSSNSSYKPAADLLNPNSTLNTVFSLYMSKTNSTITNKQSVVQVSMSRQPGTPTMTTVSASCLVNLFKNDTAEAWLDTNYNWLPNITVVPMRMSAFYYSPISNMQIVWSVATAPSSNQAFRLTAESSLQYNSVIINLGEVWSLTRNAATITVPGIYYTVVTMGISCVQPTVFWLKVNTENVFKVIISSKVHQTRDNGAVIRLEVGDTLNVTMESPLSVSASYYHQTVIPKHGQT